MSTEKLRDAIAAEVHRQAQPMGLKKNLCDERADAILALPEMVARLLPEGGEDRTEDAYWIEDKAVLLPWSDYLATQPITPNRRRTVTKWPDGTELVGPWVAVDEGSGT